MNNVPINQKINIEISKIVGLVVHYGAPPLKIVFKHKLLAISFFNTVVSVLLVGLLAVKTLFLLKNNTFWWRIGTQLDGGDTNSLGYYRSLAENNFLISALVLLGFALLAFQTFKLFDQARKEKWDKVKGKKGWARLAGLVIYTVIIIGFLIMIGLVD